MSILWAGGEDVDFYPCPPADASAWAFRSGYARHGLRMTNWNNSGRSNQFPGGSVTTVWLSLRAYTSAASSTMTRWFGLIQYDQVNKGIWFGQASASPNLTFGTYDGASYTIKGTGSDNTWSYDTIHKVDVCITSYGVSANVKVYIDGSGSAHIDYTGDISVSGVSGFNCIGLYLPSTGTSTNALSEFIVADEDTRTKNLVTHYPNAAGDLMQWTGAYTDVDEATINDADKVYTDTDAQDAQFGLSNCPAGYFNVSAIKIVARAARDAAASVTNLKLGVKSGGSVDVDAGQAVGTSYTSLERLTTTINGSPITTAILDAMQLNLRSAA